VLSTILSSAPKQWAPPLLFLSAYILPFSIIFLVLPIFILLFTCEFFFNHLFFSICREIDSDFSPLVCNTFLFYLTSTFSLPLRMSLPTFSSLFCKDVFPFRSSFNRDHNLHTLSNVINSDLFVLLILGFFSLPFFPLFNSYSLQV